MVRLLLQRYKMTKKITTEQKRQEQINESHRPRGSQMPPRRQPPQQQPPQQQPPQQPPQQQPSGGKEKK